MKLIDLLENIEYAVIYGDMLGTKVVDIEVNKLIYDSRKVHAQDVFVCISGAKRDAHDFIGDVINKGAKAVVVEKDITQYRYEQLREETDGKVESVSIIKVESTRYALGCM